MIESTAPTLFSAGLRMFWGLLVVLGILLIIYAIMRKKLSFIKHNDNSAIKIKEIRHLMPKKSLCLVEVGNQEYLLGLGNDTITLISPVSSIQDKTFDEILATNHTESSDAN